MQSLRRLRVAPPFVLSPLQRASSLVTSQDAPPLPYISPLYPVTSFVSMVRTTAAPVTPLTAYERRMGTPNRKRQEPLPPLTLSTILEEACRRKRTNIIRAIAMDFLRSEEQPSYLALQFLRAAAKYGVIPNSQVVKIYKILCDEDGQPTVKVPVRSFARVAMAMLSKAHRTPEVVDQIARYIDADALERHSLYPEILVHFLLEMILKGDTSRTAMLLGKLRGTVVLSFESIERVQHVQDRKTLLLCVLLHSCTTRKWWSLGISICRALFHSPPNEAKTAMGCIQVFLQSGLKHLTPTTLQAYADLIIDIEESGLPAFDTVTLQQFYSACANARRPVLTLAAQVYLALRKECSQKPSTPSTEQYQATVKPHYRYLPPTGQPMLAMMKFFFKNGDQRTAHMLAFDIEPLLQTLPYHSLPEYLLLLSDHSFHRRTRTAYERYAASSDPLVHSIVAHPVVAKRLVSMAMHRVTVARAKVENGGDEADRHAANALDCYQFARFVATNFAKSCLPLYSADYQKLTALTHILLLVGDYEAATVAVEARLTIPGDQPPDLLDISILLNAIGRHDPYFVIETIKNMLESGLQPDLELYGQVVQLCLRHDMPHLAGELLQLAQSRHPKLLQPKTLGAILWYSVSHLNHLTSDEKIARLETIYKLLTNFSPQQGEQIKSPAATTLNIARQAFKEAVELDAPLATKYYETFLKGKVIRASDSGESLAQRSGKDYADWQIGMLGRAWKGHREGWLKDRKPLLLFS
jgi:hypothetical protein